MGAALGRVGGVPIQRGGRRWRGRIGRRVWLVYHVCVNHVRVHRVRLHPIHSQKVSFGQQSWGDVYDLGWGGGLLGSKVHGDEA